MPDLSMILADWTVLVVDDEPDNLDVARRLLAKSGAEVITAENGQIALDMLKTTHPNFILADISMPEMDGWTFINVLNKDRTKAHIPVIALTAHTMPGDRERAFEAGFVNYISKPLDARKFITNLLNILIDIPEMRDHLDRFKFATNTDS